jgi:hypothetical protein
MLAHDHSPVVAAVVAVAVAAVAAVVVLTGAAVQLQMIWL